jgi:hypothetical protein
MAKTYYGEQMMAMVAKVVGLLALPRLFPEFEE